MHVPTRLVDLEPAGSAAAQIAVATALLRAAAAGEHPSVIRLYRPVATVAFGSRDRLLPGFGAAVRAARAQGFEPVLRGPGGRCAAYHPGCLVADLVLAGSTVADITRRFDEATQTLAGGLAGLGLDVRIGALAGEYCPGEHSVNLRGRVKVAGVAQRVIRGAALLGIVITVEDPDPVRAVLVSVYAALGLDFDPATFGAVADADSALDVPAVAARLAEVFSPGGTDVGLTPDLERVAAEVGGEVAL